IRVTWALGTRSQQGAQTAKAARQGAVWQPYRSEEGRGHARPCATEAARRGGRRAPPHAALGRDGGRKHAVLRRSYVLLRPGAAGHHASLPATPLTPVRARGLPDASRAVVANTSGWPAVRVCRSVYPGLAPGGRHPGRGAARPPPPVPPSAGNPAALDGLSH